MSDVGQDVYVDLYFMINFSMDFLCFFLSARILGRRLSLWRTLLSSVLGGIYATVALFVYLGGFAAIAIDIAFCLFMSAIVLMDKKNSFSSIGVFTLFYFVISMVLGGIMTGVFNLINRASLPLESIESDGISAWILLILALGAAAVTLMGGDFFKKKSQTSRAEIEMVLFGRRMSFCAIVDSGNLLRDPFSNKSVIVIDFKRCSGMLPRQIVDFAESGDISALTSLDESVSSRVRLIPATTAVGEGMMVGIKPDSVVVKSGRGKQSVDCLVALSDINTGESECGAILPVSLLT